MVKNVHLKVTGVIFLLLMASTVFVLLLNTSQTKSITAQTYTTPTGTTTTINTSCQSIPNVAGNTLCNLSNKINQSSIPPIISSACPNGGIPLNNICPVSVVPLQTNPINQTQPTVSPPPVIIPSETIQVIPNVSLLGNDGVTRTLSSDSLQFQLASFVGNTFFSFVSPSSQTVDVSSGKLNLQIQIKAKPNESINANGTLWFSVNNYIIHPVGIFWTAIGTTDANGILNSHIQTPNGIIDTYVYDISGLTTTSQPALQTSNILNFTVSNLAVQNQIGQSYKNVKMQKLYTLELDSDQQMVIEKNSAGNYVKVYPSDDVFTISSAGSSSTTYSTPCPKCGQGYSVTSVSQPLSAGSVQIFKTSDSGDILIGSTNVVSGVGGGCLRYNGATSDCGNSLDGAASATISNIPRDTDIKIVISGGAIPLTKILHTPTTQQTWSYNCDSKTCSFLP